jgi:hypothetical protein
MSDGLGKYHFMAWSRRGLVASLTNPDYGGSLPLRGPLQVDLTVSAQGPNPTTSPVPTVNVQTYGPIDILGFDVRHVVRTEPREFTPNFEPNYLAGIELDEPDLPWLFTPASPAGDRIRPWFVLIVLKADEFTPVPGAPQPLPAIDVGNVGALQSLDDSWNWAHTQVSGDGGLAGTMSAAPASVIARLLCPRRLDPETAYTAFLVPAFEAGRRAGLGDDLTGITSSDPAWTAATKAPLRLPVYYRFQFQTSDQGDFESLVRRLVPRKLGSDIGQRPMAVDTPMVGIPSAGPPLALLGALQSLVVKPTEWVDPDKTNFQTAVEDFVNRTSPLIDDPSQPDPEVVPPIYGMWHAGVSSVSRTGTSWLDELNLDPRNRTQAGMGTQVVQTNLTSLMASAWQQVAGVEQANAMLRRAQFARAISTALHALRFTPASQTKVLALTAPLHARMLASPKTVRATISASRVPLRLFSAPMRRITSAASAVRRRQKRLGAVPGSIVERVNANTATIVPPVKPPSGLVSIEDISQKVVPRWAQFFPIVLTVDTPVGDFKVSVELGDKFASGAVTVASLKPENISAIPARPEFTVTTPGSATMAGATSGATALAAAVDSPDAKAFRTALMPWTTALQGATPDPPLAPALELAQLRNTVLARIDPAVTVPARLASLIRLTDKIKWNPPDPIQPITAAPSFPQPLYAKVRDLSPAYILPGIDKILPDTVGLLESNHAFIEAVMVGANHEMARQLLWAGYPTDCRGSYFRQFWDVSRYVRQAGDPADPDALAELLKDIPPIHTWPLPAPLGDHENRADIVPNNVVLIIRGELLRRYPDAIIYAAKAKVEDGKRIIDTSDERFPIFGGELPTDITFLGFNLSRDDAKGGTATAPQGFFFVFQQHPTGPRFGLEPSDGTADSWASLAWTNFYASSVAAPLHAAALPARTFAGPWTAQRLPSQMMKLALAGGKLPDFLSASLAPDVSFSTGEDALFAWGKDAAQTAAITLRLPFRVAIHAELMVPDS